MTRKPLVVIAVLCLLGAVAVKEVILPSNWRIATPSGPLAIVGTMPDGLALSPDGTKLAVVDGGFNPPDLRILDVGDLHQLQKFDLADAFGTPVWSDATHVHVAGGSTGGNILVDLASGKISDTQKSDGYVSAVFDATTSAIDSAPQHAAAIVRTSGGAVYIANRGESDLTYVPSPNAPPVQVPVDLHPAALAFSPDGTRLYVACTDADAVDVVDVKSNRVVARIDVGLPQGPGASPNALAVAKDGTVYVSLGAENAVGEIRDDKLVARMPAGWYPTGVAVDKDFVYVSNGKGESSRANPEFDPSKRHSGGYVAATLVGSVRKIARSGFTLASTAEVAANLPVPLATPAQTTLRPNGPIQHVIYIIKENRTYDQVLGDIRGADGDPQLTWFGRQVTPNQHAIAERFGIFDATFTDAQISATGHNWSTAAFANDYLERFWPPNYGDRRKTYDFEDGAVASTPRNGYLWDDCNRAGVTFRDYGEFVTNPVAKDGTVTTQMPGLQGKIDPLYPGFDLNYSDEARVDEWLREFNQFVTDGDLPALEIIRLPNDHTAGTRPGALTPISYVAQNDHAFGRIVDIVSHSPYWAHTAIFAIEDDAQNGPDHVDNQRTTFYLASPYAASGVHHARYSTTSVVRTIELLLGLPSMSIYDAVAPPLYDAFTLTPDLHPYSVISPQTDDTMKNERTAYGASASERMDFTHADAADPRVLNDILAHAAGPR